MSEGLKNSLSDQEIYEKFEELTLQAVDFDHVQHVRMAWIYLQKYGVLKALEQFPAALKKYAEANGAKNRYHETVTWAYLLLINERIEKTGREKSWSDFVSENQDLLVWQNGALSRYYRVETIESELAKRVFVFPDKAEIIGS